jgi:hypothetical protein
MDLKDLPNLLTRRQYQIGMLLANGGSLKTIQTETGISRSCLQFHLYNLRQKFGCENNFQLGYELRPILDDLTQSLQKLDLKHSDPFHWPQPDKKTIDYEPFEETEDPQRFQLQFPDDLMPISQVSP